MHLRRTSLLIAHAFLFLSISFSTASAQLSADFSAGNTEGCGSVVVQFSDLSTGSPTDWIWDFGDNTSATGIANPSHIYTSVGCFDVTLIITDGLVFDTIVKSCFVEVHDFPAPAFSSNLTIGCAPLTVQFTDNSVPNGNSIVSWAWEFCSGITDSVANPLVTFTNPGDCDVKLVVTNNFGCQGLVIVPDYFTVNDVPVADFTQNVSTSCTSPLTVNFTNTSITNGLPGITYEWFFPGGFPGSFSGANPPPITYGSSGNFDISLIAASSNGCADTLDVISAITIGNVTADFTTSDTVVCQGEPIMFANSSIGGASVFEWDFDCDGTADATGDTVTFTFNTPGNICVALWASNPTGCGDTLTTSITVLPKPVADFTANVTADCKFPTDTITFSDLTPNAASWNWTFGGCAVTSSNTAPNPWVVYNCNPNGTICLQIVDVNGCRDTVCKTNFINLQPPDAAFTADTAEGCIPLTVNLLDNSTANSPVTAWDWSITPATGATPSVSNMQNPLVTFTDQALYDVKLVIQTSNGCTDSITKTQYIKAGFPPMLDFTWDKDTVCVNEVVKFFSVFSDSLWTYEWDFMYNGVTFNPMNNMQDPTFSYPDTGLYSVALVIENFGCRDTLIKNDIIYVQPPRADFIVLPLIACGVPATFTFTDESVLADAWEWYFEGTLFSSVQNPSPYTFSGPPGNYTFLQVVTNAMTGCLDSTEVTVTVGDPLADFFTTDTFGCHPYAVSFTNTSQFSSSYNWYFGSPGGPVNAVDPLYTYQAPGIYSVTLIASDSNGCADTILKQNYIEVVGPIADFSSNTVVGCPGLTVNFFDQSVTTGGFVLTNWEWTFGDTLSGPGNNTSSLQNPTHVYNYPGTYKVTLTVTDSYGCTDKIVYQNYVTVTFPVPDFSVMDTSTCPGNAVQFDDFSTGVGISWYWDFGDGDTSVLQNPAHAYQDTGFYTVKLIVTDVNGCVDSLIRPNYIYIEYFEANFNGSPLTGICPPLFTNFNDLSIGNIGAWEWDFGDGTMPSVQQNPGHIYTISGYFDVGLVAIHEDGCRDTLIRDDYVFIDGPFGTFDFFPKDACPFDTITFEIYTERTTFIEIEPVAGQVYLIPTTTTGSDTVRFKFPYLNPGLFCPAINLKDASGCEYTIPCSDSVFIHKPPVALFTASPLSSCLPFTLTLSDNSVPGESPIVGYFWDLAIDTTSMQNPTITYDSAAVYPLLLTVTDTLGCVGFARDTVEALPLPEANFVASDTFGCSPSFTLFTDLTSVTTPVQWNWNFGDGGTDTLQNPSYTYQQDGLYTVSLMVSDANGCKDTLTKPQYIFLRHPMAHLYGNNMQGCNPVTLTFYADSSVSDTGIVNYDWCVIDNSNNQSVCFSTTVDSAQYTFADQGSFTIRLIITGVLGCSDTAFLSPVIIDETVTPPPLSIERVSVLDDKSVQIDYVPYGLTDFFQYILYRESGGTYIAIDSSDIQSNTTFIDMSPGLDASQQSYCYKIRVQNICLRKSPMASTQAHCTIELQTAPGIDEISLDWNPYVGWNQVLRYDVFRAFSYDTATLVQIGSVAGTQTFFTDTDMFCMDSVQYRIMAVKSGPVPLISYSDTSGNAPIHLPPVEMMHISTATVFEDSTVIIRWRPYTGYKPASYELEKSDDDGATWSVLQSFPPNILTYEDPDVEVDDRSYRYRVNAIDSCGDRSQQGRIGRTILLNTTLQVDYPELSWSPYRKWRNDVQRYEIEVFNELTQAFEYVDAVNGNVLKYMDRKTQFNQPYYCYRIRAVESGGLQETAFSNEDCVIFGPAIFAPNAFSPNGDGINDEFLLKGPNVEQVEFLVFDRWGELVFEADNLLDGWDGTYKGRAAQEGVYVFVFRGTGYDGTKLERSGTITLIR